MNSLIILSVISFPFCSKINNKKVQQKYASFIYESEKISRKLPYRLYTPDNFNIKAEYPLILILHGGSELGSDNKKQLTLPAEIFSSAKVQKKNPCFILVPQCPKGEQWLNTTFKKPPFSNYSQENIPESNSMKMTIELINALCNDYPVDRNKIYVTGYSMGGSGTWDIITRYPGFFAAAVPVTGVSDPLKAQKIKQLPIWAFHGSKDTISPVQVTRNMVNALKAAKGNIIFTEYRDIAHNSWDTAYNNSAMIEWLFRQKKQMP
ncbi:MAG: dienelactone hydrolase family protein [Spirochaetes bacterium]|nr:dienelactone hydrolase family protein [Spirochaetota bacterium]